MLNTILCIEFTPQIAAEVFYNGEMEAELHRVGLIEYRFKSDSDREECMSILETKRRESVYPHCVCTDDCKKRGNYKIISSTLSRI